MILRAFGAEIRYFSDDDDLDFQDLRSERWIFYSWCKSPKRWCKIQKVSKPCFKVPSRIYSYKISDIGDFMVTGLGVFHL